MSEWYSRWSYGVFFIATLGAAQTLRVLFNGLGVVLGGPKVFSSATGGSVQALRVLFNSP